MSASLTLTSRDCRLLFRRLEDNGRVGSGGGKGVGDDETTRRKTSGGATANVLRGKNGRVIRVVFDDVKLEKWREGGERMFSALYDDASDR